MQNTKILPNYGFLNRLENAKFPTAINGIIAPLEREGVELGESLTARALANVRAETNNIKLLQKMIHSHPLTAEIIEHVEKRHQAIMSLVQSTEAAQHSVNKERRESSKVVRMLLQPYRREFTKKGAGYISGVITFFETSYIESEVLRDALKTLDLEDQFQYVVDLTNEINLKVTKRNSDNKELYSRAQKTRNAIYHSFKQLLVSLVGEAMDDKNGDGKFYTLYLDVAEQLKYYQSTSSKRKSKADDSNFDEKNDEKKSDAKDNPSEE